MGYGILRLRVRRALRREQRSVVAFQLGEGGRDRRLRRRQHCSRGEHAARIGVGTLVTHDAATIEEADRIILPGKGRATTHARGSCV